MKKIFARNYKKNPARLAIDLVVLACVILLGVSLFLWWTRIFMNPQRTLDDTIANNLKTRSITKSVNQSGATGGINQVTYLTFFPPTVASQTDTVLTQGAGSNANSVTTQTIGTSSEDFIRYTNVKTSNQESSERVKGLLGEWAKRQQDLAKGQRVSFLNESMFSIVPFGYFNDSQSAQLLDLIKQKNVYKYNSAKRMIQNKRPVYVYDMSINPADLVTVLQEYIRLSGAGDPSQFNPAQYQGLSDVKVKMTIDILSRQIVDVQYSTGRTENYSGQNLYHPIELPTETIPVEELQKRLQGLSA